MPMSPPKAKKHGTVPGVASGSAKGYARAHGGRTGCASDPEEENSRPTSDERDGGVSGSGAFSLHPSGWKDAFPVQLRAVGGTSLSL